MAAEAKASLGAFWGEGRLQLLCTAVIERFLPLTVHLDVCSAAGPTHPDVASMGFCSYRWLASALWPACFGSAGEGVERGVEA